MALMITVCQSRNNLKLTSIQQSECHRITEQTIQVFCEKLGENLQKTRN